MQYSSLKCMYYRSKNQKVRAQLIFAQAENKSALAEESQNTTDMGWKYVIFVERLRKMQEGAEKRRKKNAL